MSRPARPTSGRTTMKYLLALLAVLGVALGVAAVVYGGADDSPGLQGLGVLLVLGAVVFGVRTVRRSS
jgi:drug/metabolite transporter (DMT)-like permease